MQIAFTSCFSAQSFHDQPVWDQIAATSATHLVLLGDAAYYDVDDASMGQVKAMGANDFAIHAYRRLRQQLNQPQFAALIRRADLTTHAIWDDHDFLWNGACGAQVQGQPSFRHLIPPTRAAFEAFRNALDSRDPGGFPADPPQWLPNVPAPGYRQVALGEGVLLHLTDGRSFKARGGEKALLGETQIAQMEAAFEAAPPDTLHLVASGVVFEARNGETWMDCQSEHGRLLELARRFRVLVLSGDIHENRFAQYVNGAGGRPMFEATASGAAVRTAVVFGALQCNWGLLDIDAQGVQIQLSQRNMPPRRRVIDRESWQLMA